MQQAADSSGSLIVSYLTLRKVIGILGLLLPFILAIGGFLIFEPPVIMPSISDYYHTDMGDIFVGTLFAVGFFLLSYKGYEKKDDIAGDVGWIAAIGVALYPTDPSCKIPLTGSLTTCFHGFFAAVFFLILAYFALFLFTKSHPAKTPTARKLLRNRIYRACGYLILAAIAFIMLLHVLPEDFETAVKAYNPVFWLESIAVVAFGISWLVKGEGILADLPG